MCRQHTHGLYNLKYLSSTFCDEENEFSWVCVEYMPLMWLEIRSLLVRTSRCNVARCQRHRNYLANTEGSMTSSEVHPSVFGLEACVCIPYLYRNEDLRNIDKQLLVDHFTSLPFPFPLSFPCPSFPFSSEVGPLKPARGSGECCKLPNGVRCGAPAENQFGAL